MHIIVTGPNGRQYDGEVEGDNLVEALAEQVATQAGVPADNVSSLSLSASLCVSVALSIAASRPLSLSLPLPPARAPSPCVALSPAPPPPLPSHFLSFPLAAPALSLCLFSALPL